MERSTVNLVLSDHPKAVYNAVYKTDDSLIQEVEPVEKPFVEAARDEDKKRIKQLLQKEPAFISKHIDEQDEDGITALHMSIGNKEFMKQLLRKKADCNLVNRFGETPLHIAAKMDLVDTVLLLILHGADVRIQHRNKDAINPAETANDVNANSCLNVMLFCGADYPESDLNKVSSTEKLTEQEITEKEDREKHRQIVSGYQERKIAYSGQNLGKNGWRQDNIPAAEHRQHVQKELGLSIKLSSNDADMLFLCRRIDSSYQTSCMSGIPVIETVSGESLVSNIFQFRVDHEVHCSSISIRIFMKDDPELEKYRDIVLIQVFGGKATLQEKKIFYTNKVYGDQARFDNVRLYSNTNDGGYTSMGVYSKNKMETINIKAGTNVEQTFQSTVEPKFKVTLSPVSQEGVENVEIEVTKVDKDAQSDVKPSDFCSISSKIKVAKTAKSRSSSLNGSTASSQFEKNSIDLPLPEVLPERNPSTKSVIIVCPSENSPDDGGNWKSVDGTKTENAEAGTVSVEGNGVGFGRYIVLVVKKMARFGYNMKMMVREMYLKASGTTVKCVLFAAVRRKQAHEFLVQVTLCTETEKDQETQELQLNGFVLEKCSRVFMKMKTQLTYYLQLDVKDGSYYPDRSLPIKYQQNLPKYHRYTVTPAGPEVVPDGYMAVHDRNPLKKTRKDSDRAAALFPVSFELIRSEPRTAFPCDELIHSLAAKMGHSYFPIAIYLDIPAARLQLLDDVKAITRCEEVLYIWRRDYFPDGEEALIGDGLSILIGSLKAAGRLDIRSMLVQAVESGDRKGREYEWLSSFKENGEYNLKSLSRFEMCPFSDAFLYKVATEIITEDGILLELNAGNDKTLAEQNSKWSVERKTFEVLLRARQKDKHFPPIDSLGTLISAMRRHGLNLTVEKLGKIVKSWHSRMLRENDQTFNKTTMDKVKQIFKLD